MLSMNAPRGAETAADPGNRSGRSRPTASSGAADARAHGAEVQWLLVDDDFVVLDLDAGSARVLDREAVGRPLGEWLHRDDLRCSPTALGREGREATLRFRDRTGRWSRCRVRVDRLDRSPDPVPDAAWLVVLEDLAEPPSGATVIDVTDRLVGAERDRPGTPGPPA